MLSVVDSDGKTFVTFILVMVSIGLTGEALGYNGISEGLYGLVLQEKGKRKSKG